MIFCSLEQHCFSSFVSFVLRHQCLVHEVRALSSVTILVPVHFYKQQQAVIKILTQKRSLIRIIKSKLFCLFLTLFKQVQLYYFLHLLFLKCKETTEVVSIIKYNKKNGYIYVYIYIHPFTKTLLFQKYISYICMNAEKRHKQDGHTLHQPRGVAITCNCFFDMHICLIYIY